MKNIFTLLLVVVTLGATAQKAEKVYGPARVHKPMSYYKEQSALWKKEIDKNAKNGEAWYNYYNANRILMFNDAEDSRNIEQREKAVNQIVEDMGKEIPESYEYNLCMWQIGGSDLKNLPYLKKAAALGENRTEHIDFMINVSELTRNMADRDKYSKRKNEIGEMSAGMQYYNSNVLNGLPKNTILITAGDNDTYPAWMVQSLGIRKDVTVINLYLIAIEEYRNKVFAELGIPKLNRNENVQSDSAFNKALIKHIAGNSKKYPVSVAISALSCQQYSEQIQENLYLTGLAYQYSDESVDNMAIMKKNFEQVYALDYIDKPFYTEISPEKVGFMNLNYLIPMLKLYDHYKISGDIQKKDWIKNKIDLIAKDSPEAEEVRKYLSAQ